MGFAKQWVTERIIQQHALTKSYIEHLVADAIEIQANGGVLTDEMNEEIKIQVEGVKVLVTEMARRGYYYDLSELKFKKETTE